MKMKAITKACLIGGALGLSTLGHIQSATAAGDTAMTHQAVKFKAVYHIDDADKQGLKALRNINNHLNTAPDTVITVVAHSKGVDFLMEGAKSKDGTSYAPLVSGLTARGVHFEVCEITLSRRKLSKDKFILETEYTPSGVVRLTELQVAEGYAYIKP